MLSQVYNKDFIFNKYCNTNKFAAKSFGSEQNGLREFKNRLELFYCDTTKIKRNNDGQKTDFKKNHAVCYSF